MKQFKLQYNVGKAKYVINIHDGFSKYPDNSPFYGIEIFKNKSLFNTRINELLKDGYVESDTNTPHIKNSMFGDLNALVRSLESWSERNYKLNKIEERTRNWKFPITNDSTYFKHRDVTWLLEKTEVHVSRLIYVNIVETFVKAYFYENYFNLSDDVLKTYDALTWFEQDFITDLDKLLNKNQYSVIRYTWSDLIENDELFPELIYNTWKKVETDINSKTLKLELF